MLTDFLKHVISECEIHSVDLLLVNDSIVTSEGAPCGGLFSHVDRTLTVAVADKDWVHYLAHEFGHMQQAIEGLYDMSLDPTVKTKQTEDSYIALDAWLGGKEYKKTQIAKHVRHIIDCEMDADKRAVDLLSRYQCYPAELYIQEANNTLYAYSYALKHRVWKLPNIERVIKVVPKRFCQTPVEYLEIPPALERVFSRCKK